jgi:hypothetical protein
MQHARHADPTAAPGFDRRRFRSLLGMYVLGLSIGFLLLGLIWMARYRAAQQARQSQSAPPATTQPATPLTPAPR